MLHRAASNAFSWWWASHIRTKQSKWLEQSLQDMEEKVTQVLNLIQKDGDSFARRAEMYYRHHPDVISFVEETFRAYRALAERYDKLSRELQKANTTIASIFPDQVSYDDFDDDYGQGRAKKRINFPIQNQGPNAGNIPKVPELPNKDLKGLISNASKKIQVTKAFKADNSTAVVPRSGLSEEQALEEIDKIQKEILAMQTMKEFTKSSYESRLAKYWDIENKITQMQQRVCRLQDEFKVGRVIEDNDARTVMAQAALKSCQETLEQLEAKHEKSSQDARVEHERILDAKLKIKGLKRKIFPDETDESEADGGGKLQISNQANLKEFTENLEGSFKRITVSELAETVDKLANKAIRLESSVSSQTALIDRLKVETSDLQMQVRCLEEDKASSADGGRTLRKKFKAIEEKLCGVEDLDKNVEKQNNSLKTHFTEARCTLEHLSRKLHDVQPDEEVDVCCHSPLERKLQTKDSCVEDEDTPCRIDAGVKNTNAINEQGDANERNTTVKHIIGMNDDDVKINVDVRKCEFETKERNTCLNDVASKDSSASKREKVEELTINEAAEPKISRSQEVKDGALESESHEPDGDNDGKEKTPVEEYTTMLKNYKNTKKKLSKADKRKQLTLFELVVQVRELKSGIAKRDHEIQMLKQKLKQLEDAVGNYGEESFTEEKQALQDDAPSEEISVEESEPPSEIEQTLRTDIDALLDENLDFWLRFSSQFHQVQKFKTEVEDLQEEIAKIKAKATEGKTNTSMFTTDLRSDIRPIYKHLKEKQNELTIWLEQSESLKEELHRRCTSLSNIQEEITMALKEGMVEEEIKFSTHQAAKFQGEILNMQQENNRVDEELQAGLDHVRALQLETKLTIRKLEEEFGLSDNQNQYQQAMVLSPTRPGIPLRSFLFGVKTKKQKPSIFGCIHQAKKFKGGLR